MDRDSLELELKSIIEYFLRPEGLELVELIVRQEGRNLVIRALVDRPEGGISIGECSRLNSDIGRALDEKDILQQSYILEVSSPGLDRPLKTKNDFLRCVNRKVRVFLKEKIKEKFELEGIIIKADDYSVFLNVLGEEVEVPLQTIAKARQIITN